MDLSTAITAALRNIVAFGDTDVFPFPIERSVVADSHAACESLITNLHNTLDDFLAQHSPLIIHALAPIGYTGFRWATQIEPFWNVDAGIARLARFRELLDHGSLEEQKSLVRAFLARIDLSSKDGHGSAHFYRLPTSCSFELVAGARYEPVQKTLEPAESFLAGGRELRRVA